jgi:hypothetical protein
MPFTYPLPHPSWVQIFSSAAHSQTPSVHVLQLNVRDQVSHPHKTTGKVMAFVYFGPYISKIADRKAKDFELRVSTFKLQSALNFFVNAILICHSQTVDNIRMDLGVVGWGDVDWIGPAQDRNR